MPAAFKCSNVLLFYYSNVQGLNIRLFDYSIVLLFNYVSVKSDIAHRTSHIRLPKSDIIYRPPIKTQIPDNGSSLHRFHLQIWLKDNNCAHFINQSFILAILFFCSWFEDCCRSDFWSESLVYSLNRYIGECPLQMFYKRLSKTGWLRKLVLHGKRISDHKTIHIFMRNVILQKGYNIFWVYWSKRTCYHSEFISNCKPHTLLTIIDGYYPAQILYFPAKLRRINFE